MGDILKDQEEDESFVLRLRGEVSQLDQFLSKLNRYFSERYGKGIEDLRIGFDDTLNEWVVSSSESTLRTEYYETIPELVAILRRG